MTNIFEEVRTRLTMEDVARHYGHEPNRSGFICCPFHGERTPSMKLYPDAGGYYCFACHAGGSVVDFVGQLFGLDALAAVRQLAEDFSLGLPIDQRPTSEDRRAARHRAEVAATQQAFDAWRQAMINRLNSCIRIANQARPATWEDLTDQQILALRWRDTLEHYSDTLMGGSMDEQMQVFRCRREVSDICNRILSDSQMKSTAA